MTISNYATSADYYPSGKLVIDEHFGTHLDANNHIINSEDTMAEHGIPNEQRTGMAQIGVSDIIGPVVLIDIGPRVRAELAKNNCKPSPDVSVTDFSENSGNVVTAADIDAVADQLVDGAWIVINLDWAQFYFDDDVSLRSSPYFNNFNHPGLNRGAVDRLAEIIDQRGLKLGGIAIDNIAVDTGEGNRFDGQAGVKNAPWYSHPVLMQRGVLFVENLAKIGELVKVVSMGAKCTLIIGALKHVRGTGSPARVLAMCDG